MKKFLKSYWTNEAGATSIEYGLIATLVCSAAIAGITNFGNNLGIMWGKIANKMS